MDAPIYDLPRRPRRLRRNEAIRALVQETWLRPKNLVQPLFVIDETDGCEPVASMPGVERLGREPLLKTCEHLLDIGIRAIALFPRIDPALKTPNATEAFNPETLVLRTIRELKVHFPELLIIADIALDPYTSHGHDGLLMASGNDVDNDATVEALAHMALLHAEAGADWLAPSDMMDGRVGIIRETLDAAAHTETAILAYTAKYASAYYGPFRDAVGSAQAKPLSKATYQLNPANRREALVEALLDESEGADALMVKPAGSYLDIIRDLRERTPLPLAAYQVSGEYAQIHAAAQQGWLDYETTRDESLMAIKRAGADFILTYFAGEVAKTLRA